MLLQFMMGMEDGKFLTYAPKYYFKSLMKWFLKINQKYKINKS